LRASVASCQGVLSLGHLRFHQVRPCCAMRSSSCLEGAVRSS
jgi:hypothetical protein